MIRRPLTPQEQERSRTLVAWAMALAIGRKVLSDSPGAESLRGLSRWTCANPCNCPDYRHDRHTHEHDYTNRREHL